jgi:hypothetical protein
VRYADRVAVGEVSWHEDPDVRKLSVAVNRYGESIALDAGLGFWRVWLTPAAQVRRLEGRTRRRRIRTDERS